MTSLCITLFFDTLTCAGLCTILMQRISAKSLLSLERKNTRSVMKNLLNAQT